jgi:DNA-binding NarL/FixJ family response regulator
MPDADDATISPLHPGPPVVVVDDDHAERLGISRMIRGLGYPTRNCRRGPDALRFLQSHPHRVRILVAALEMPGMDGGELVERALDVDRTLPVVLMADLEHPKPPSSSPATGTSRFSSSRFGSPTCTVRWSHLWGRRVRPARPLRSARRNCGRADGPRATIACETLQFMVAGERAGSRAKIVRHLARRRAKAAALESAPPVTAQPKSPPAT